MQRIAVIITCHNRRDTTLACLEGLSRQCLPHGAGLHVYLTDDGSSDGTADAVRAAYPEVTILHGNGSLFWCGGMRLAYGEALRHDYDYYLWLNDDTVLQPDTVEKLLHTHGNVRHMSGRESVVVGTTRDALTGQPTYGGVIRPSPLMRLRFRMVAPRNEPVECETMNGNCVLIPGPLGRDIGNLDAAFTHCIGDFDYGLRIRQRGYRIWVMPGFAGVCSRNSVKNSFNDRALPLRERLGKLAHPKGLPPAEWKVFCSRYAGVLWPAYYAWPRLKTVMTSICNRM